ncbi:MAG: ABC transporter substrate-binding protein, partial [Betaproteobacteria bacterium]
MSENKDKKTTLEKAENPSRRNLIKSTIGAAIIAAPFIRNAEAAKTTTWKVQTSWDAGTTGYKLFETWANSFKEKSGGELD